MDYLAILIAMGGTFVFSYLVGLERQNIGKDAGISAHVIMAISACALAILQGLLCDQAIDKAESTGAVASIENQRLISQLVTGMGFIGAGVIMKSRGHVRGLTTAATLWGCAVIGIIFGSGFWQFGLIFGGFIVVFMYVRDLSRKMNPFKKRIEHEDHLTNDK